MLFLPPVKMMTGMICIFYRINCIVKDILAIFLTNFYYLLENSANQPHGFLRRPFVTVKFIYSIDADFTMPASAFSTFAMTFSQPTILCLFSKYFGSLYDIHT